MDGREKGGKEKNGSRRKGKDKGKKAAEGEDRGEEAPTKRKRATEDLLLATCHAHYEPFPSRCERCALLAAKGSLIKKRIDLLQYQTKCRFTCASSDLSVCNRLFPFRAQGLLRGGGSPHLTLPCLALLHFIVSLLHPRLKVTISAVSPETIRALFKHYRHLIPEFRPSPEDVAAFRRLSGVESSENSREAAETLFDDLEDGDVASAKGTTENLSSKGISVSFESYVRGVHVAAKTGTFEDKVRFLFQAYDL